MMTTLMLLLARHDGREEIPFQQVAKEYFHMSPESLERKIKKGVVQLDLAVGGAITVRTSRVPLTHLARYIQKRREIAAQRMEEYALQ